MNAEPLIARCPLGCAASLETTSIQLPEGPLRRCAGCGQLVSSATPTRYAESMAADFDTSEGTLPTGRGARRLEHRLDRRARKYGRMFMRALGRPPHEIDLLDVGASSGVFLSRMAPLGFRAMGVEPAPKAAEGARARGLDVRTGTLEEVGLPGDSVDVVTLFEVIEHVTEPVALLRECHRVLRPGGVMLLSTGNAASVTARTMGARWGYFHIQWHGGHVSFFDPRTMRLAAERAGFRVERVFTNGVQFYERTETPWPLYRSTRVLAELVAPFVRLLGRGHDMRVLLRKPV